MSIDNSKHETKNSESPSAETTGDQNDNDKVLKSHFQQGGRYFLKDPASGEYLNVSRLTAYSEYGKRIHGRDTHHEIPLLKIDAPRFIDALKQETHTGYHNQNPEPKEVDGFPLLRPER